MSAGDFSNSLLVSTLLLNVIVLYRPFSMMQNEKYIPKGSRIVHGRMYIADMF